jgi:hypothetical protein
MQLAAVGSSVFSTLLLDVETAVKININLIMTCFHLLFQPPPSICKQHLGRHYISDGILYTDLCNAACTSGMCSTHLACTALSATPLHMQQLACLPEHTNAPVCQTLCRHFQRTTTCQHCVAFSTQIP